MNYTYLDDFTVETIKGDNVPVLDHTAGGFLERFCGLMMKKDVPEACGLYFPRCTSIHTCMMRVPIDVLWVKEDGDGFEVVSFDAALKPWRFFNAPRGATGVIEFREGTFDVENRPVKMVRGRPRE